MVKNLEKNLKKRQDLKFIVKESPVDLTKVISVDGISIKDGTCGPLSKSLQDWYALDIEKIVKVK